VKRVKIYCSVFWLLFSAITCFAASRLSMGDFHEPGSGFFPLAVGLLTGFLALVALLQSLKLKGDEEGGVGERLRWWNIVIILAALLAYGLSLEKIGFMINTFLFMVLLLKVVDPQTWTKAILIGLATAISSDLAFNVLLGAQIPSGIIGF
jgi:putative tricarboxylic transport membrane protein